MWEIGKPDLNAFFFFFFFSPEQQMCQIWVGHSFVQYEIIRNLSFGWTKYKTEHRLEEICCSKCFVVSVIYFHVYFDKQVHKTKQNKTKTNKKKKASKKIKSSNFAESNAQRKTNYFFFSLSTNWNCNILNQFFFFFFNFQRSSCCPVPYWCQLLVRQGKVCKFSATSNSTPKLANLYMCKIKHYIYFERFCFHDTMNIAKWKYAYCALVFSCLLW